MRRERPSMMAATTSITSSGAELSQKLDAMGILWIALGNRCVDRCPLGQKLGADSGDGDDGSNNKEPNNNGPLHHFAAAFIGQHAEYQALADHDSLRHKIRLQFARVI